MDLIADIGATNTRCALLDDRGRVLAAETFQNADFTGLEGLLTIYLDHRRATDQPRRAALAVAAPVLSDDVQMVNIAWRFSQSALKTRFNLKQLIAVNDFEAIAWGLRDLGAADLHQVGSGAEPAPRSARAVLGPGSGLGVATLVPCADGWAVASGEGGHVSMPAITHEEAAVIEVIRSQSGHCSAERMLSGPGLLNIYRALARLEGVEARCAAPRDITESARQGEPLARKTRNMFFALLGTVAANLALTVGARGGIYIAGGIVPQMLKPLEESEFRERFDAKGRYRNYMEAIPTYVVTVELPAFRGLRRLLGYR